MQQNQLETTEVEALEQQTNKYSKPIDKKMQAENMRLKKRIYELERELDGLKRFIGGM